MYTKHIERALMSGLGVSEWNILNYGGIRTQYSLHKAPGIQLV